MGAGSTIKSVLIILFAITSSAGIADPQPTTLPNTLPPLSQHRFVSNEVLIQFKPGVNETVKAQVRNEANVSRKERIRPASPHSSRKGDIELDSIPTGLRVDETIRKLRSQPEVEFAEPNWIYTRQLIANDYYYTGGNLWGAYGDDLPSSSGPTGTTNGYGSQAEKAWAVGHTGSDQVYVGVIDEGIQFTHPDLDANVWINPYEPRDGKDNDRNGYIDDINGWDFVSNDNTIYDGGTKGRLDQHGTHVTGTLGAEGGNAIGVVGINWNVTYISAKFLGRTGGTTANAIKAVDYFTDLKARHGLNIVALNNSWGGGGFSQLLLDAVTRAAQQNILFIAAAGNGGGDGIGDNNDNNPSYPSNYNTSPGAGYDSVIAVAAIRSDGTLASFSNYGVTTVDIGAPGVGIYSTLPYNKYGAYSGTSMATPHVTGAAALYASTHPGASALDIKNAILYSARVTSSLAGKTLTGGRLNVGDF